jgi:hypothetical protein
LAILILAVTSVVAGAAMAGRLDAQMRSREIRLKRRMDSIGVHLDGVNYADGAR